MQTFTLSDFLNIYIIVLKIVQYCQINALFLNVTMFYTKVKKYVLSKISSSLQNSCTKLKETSGFKEYRA